MGEWSEYFEDFPDENPANYDERGRFDPTHREEAARRETAYRRLDDALRVKGVPTGNAGTKEDGSTV